MKLFIDDAGSRREVEVQSIAACCSARTVRCRRTVARLQAEKCFLARTCRARKRTSLYFAVATAKLYEVFDTLSPTPKDMGLFYGPEQATRFQADGSPLLRTTLGHTDRQKKFFKNYIFGDKITEDTHT